MPIIDPGDAFLARAEQAGGAGSLGLDHLDLTNLRVDNLSVDVAGMVTAASCTRTAQQGASTLVLTLEDRDARLLRSSLIDLNDDGRLDAILVELDLLRFRLVKAEPTYDAQTSELKLTFEEEAVALLREHDKPLAMSRANVTRAQFAHRLVREVMAYPIGFYSPEETFQQGVAKTPKSKTSQNAQRRPGFADNAKLQVAGATASADQLQQIETAMTVADEQNVTGRSRLAMLVAGIGESAFRVVKDPRSKYSGVFQADPALIDPSDTHEQALRFLLGGKGFQAGGAIAAAAAHPDWSAGTIAYNVEGDRSNFSSDQTAEHFYERWIDEAHAIVKAWNGGAAHTSSRTVVKPYIFRRGLPGKRETSWDCLQRLAGEVNWRCFVVANVVYFISEEELFMSRARAEISLDTPGVNSLKADWDEGKTAADVTLNVDAGMWSFPPGSIIALRDVGPFTGRWLVETIDRPDLFDPATDITLSKPIPKKREPAADTIQVPRDVTGDAAKIVTAAHLAARHLADLHIPYVWGGGHGVDLDTYNPRGGLDCSGGVCLVLHRAGVFDNQAVVSGDLEQWGDPGAGRQMTVYANKDHTFIVFTLPGKDPQAWEFAHRGTDGGFTNRAQRPGFDQGYTARHWKGT